MNILEQIHSPAELKYLSETQLEIVATQIRELIIKTVKLIVTQNNVYLEFGLGCGYNGVRSFFTVIETHKLCES